MLSFIQVVGRAPSRGTAPSRWRHARLLWEAAGENGMEIFSNKDKKRVDDSSRLDPSPNNIAFDKYFGSASKNGHKPSSLFYTILDIIGISIAKLYLIS
jgi:hypothetical protein